MSKREGWMAQYTRTAWRTTVVRQANGGWTFHEDNHGDDPTYGPMSKRRAIRMWRNSWYTRFERKGMRTVPKGHWTRLFPNAREAIDVSALWVGMEM